MSDYYHGTSRVVLSRKTREQLEKWIADCDHDSLRRFAIGLTGGCTPSASIRAAIRYKDTYKIRRIGDGTRETSDDGE